MFMRFISSMAVVTTAAVILVADPVSAALYPSSDGNARTSCVVHVSSGGEMTCYPTFTQAIARATGGRITDAPLDAAAAMADPAFKSRIEAAAPSDGQAVGVLQDTVVEIAYDQANFGNPHLVFYSTAGGCDNLGDVDWQVSSLPGWDNRISSFSTFSLCQADHWEHNDFQGSHTGWRDSTSWIGPAMNDQSSSIQWS